MPPAAFGTPFPCIGCAAARARRCRCHRTPCIGGAAARARRRRCHRTPCIGCEPARARSRPDGTAVMECFRTPPRSVWEGPSGNFAPVTTVEAAVVAAVVAVAPGRAHLSFEAQRRSHKAASWAFAVQHSTTSWWVCVETQKGEKGCMHLLLELNVREPWMGRTWNGR